MIKQAVFSVLVLALPLGAAAGGQQNEPPDINFQFKVDKAIDKGISWLKGKRTGSYHKEIQNGNELILLTYIHGGVPENDPDFQALLKEMLDAKLERTYKVTLQAMCLEEIERVKYQGRILQCAQFLADNISDGGEARYGQPTIFAEDIRPTPTGAPKRVDVSTTSKNADPTKVKDKEPYDPLKRVKPEVKNIQQVKRQRPGPVEHDHSNMQYHALGLRACHDAGCRFEEKFLKLLEDHWRKTIIADPGAAEEEIALDPPPSKVKPKPGSAPTAPGATVAGPLVTTRKLAAAPAGWGYQGGAAKSHGSMTVGAVGGLCILDYMMGRDWHEDKDVLRSMQWINKHFSVTDNPQLGAQWHYYYLYGLERAGMLYGTEIIGAHKWYREGAEYLLAQQAGDGHWKDVVDTCFAILFLRRATRKLDGVATGGSRR